MSRQVKSKFVLFLGGLLLCNTSILSAESYVVREYNKIAQEYKEADSRDLSNPDFLKTGSVVDEYINYAFLRNQELKASFERWSAAMEAARSADYYDEPVLSFSKTIQEHDLDYSIELSQPLPWFGKRKLRRQIALARAEAAMHDYGAVKSEIYIMVVSAFNEYVYLSRVIDVTAENLNLLSDMGKVIQAKYEASEVEFSDLTKVQVEIDKLKNQLDTLHDERLVRSSRLAALLDLETESLLPWPRTQARGTDLLPEDVLFALLSDLNPELKAMDAIVERDALAGDLARKSGYPNFKVGVDYMVMPENDAGKKPDDVSFMVGIEIPIWRSKYSAQVREAEAMRKSAEASRAKMKNDLKVELRTAIFNVKDAFRRIELFEHSLIPKGQQALDVAMNDYTSGKIEFMALIDAQRTLLQFRIMRERALADSEKALAEIGCCVGKYNSPFELLENNYAQKPER